MKKKVAWVVGDTGAGEFLTSVYHRLLEELELSIFVDSARQAAGGRPLVEAKVPYCVTDEFKDAEQYSLIICGTVVKAQQLVRLATTAAKSAGREVIWAGDFYGSGCVPEMLDLEPDWMTVIDSSAAAMLRRARPSYPDERIKIVGHPSFDRLPAMGAERETFRGRIREKFSLKPEEKLLVFFASDSKQFERQEMSDTLLGVADYCVRTGFLRPIFKFHPADQDRERLQKEVQTRFDTAIILRDTLTGDSFADLVAADVVVVQYSQLGIPASMVAPTVFVLLPSIREYLSKNSGMAWEDHFYPQIHHWVAEGIWDIHSLAPALNRLLSAEPGYHEAVKEARYRHFSHLIDGKAVERFVSFVFERVLTALH